MNDQNEEHQNDWIFDAIHGFFASSRWQGPVQTYIEKYCIYFMDQKGKVQTPDQLAELKEQQKMIHQEFTALIDSLMQSLLQDIGINQQQFLHACKEAKTRKSQWKIIKQILLVDDFDEFTKIMVKRNQDLERQALKMMLKQEDNQISKHISKKSGNKGAIEENSFSSGDDDDSDSSEDEAMKMALKASQQDADNDQKRRVEKYGGNSMYQAMSETDGFKLAMEMSQKEAAGGGGEPKKSKKSKPKPTPQDQDEFQSMMMNTTGFQKILEQSKKEEDERLKKEQNIKHNEDKLLKRGLIQSEEQNKKDKQMMDQEAEMMRQVMELSLKEAEAQKEKLRQEELKKQFMVEKSKIETDNKALLDQKDEELRKLKEQLEEQKKKQDEDMKKKAEDELNQQRENLKLAMVDLQVEVKQEAPTSTQKILEKTSFIEDETFEDRQQKLKDYQQKLTVDRENKMMSFYALADKDKQDHEIIQQQRQQQFDQMMQKMGKRNRMKNKGNKNEEDKDNEDDQIDDNYGGYGVDLFRNINKPRENKILDKTFLGELKVVEVKDSDDEEYF